MSKRIGAGLIFSVVYQNTALKQLEQMPKLVSNDVRHHKQRWSCGFSSKSLGTISVLAAFHQTQRIKGRSWSEGAFDASKIRFDRRFLDCIARLFG